MSLQENKDEALIPQVAILALALLPQAQIADKLGLSPYQVRRLMKLPRFKEHLAALTEDSMAITKQALKVETAGLAREALRVIKEQLADNSLDAVKVALKIMGFDQVEEKDHGPATINVVLPGQAPSPKDVPNEVIDVSPVEDSEN